MFLRSIQGIKLVKKGRKKVEKWSGNGQEMVISVSKLVIFVMGIKAFRLPKLAKNCHPNIQKC